MTISASSSNRVRLPGTGSELNFNFDFRILDEDDLLVVVQNNVTGVDTTKVITTDYTVSGVDQENGGTVTFLVAPLSSETVSIILDPDVEQPTSLTNKSQLPSRAIERALDRAINIIKRTRDLAARALTLGEGDADGSGAYDANSNRIENLGAAVNDNDAMTRVGTQALVDAAVITPSVTVSAAGAALIDDNTADDQLVTLGGGSKGIAIFKDTTNAAVLTELGITSGEIQTFLAAASAAAGRDALEIPQQIPGANLIDNSDFQVWQWGTGFSGSSPYAGATNDNVYQPDQWKFLTATNNSVHANKPTANDQPFGAKGVYRLVQQTSNVKWGIWQTIENRKAAPLAGKTCSLGISLKAPDDLKQFKLLVAEWSGTADDMSATPDPISAWNAAQVRPTLAGSWSFVAGAELDITVSGSGWERFELEGFTMPSSPNNLAVFLCTNDASFTGGTGTEVKVSAVKLEVGDVCTAYESPEYLAELQQCQRFYAKTFDAEVYPVQNIGSDVGGLTSFNWTTGGNRACHADWRFPVPMVGIPTVTTYNPRAADSGWRDLGNTATKAVGTITPDRQGVSIESDLVATAIDVYHIHADADARL